jgi:hypothetical protein
MGPRKAIVPVTEGNHVACRSKGVVVLSGTAVGHQRRYGVTLLLLLLLMDPSPGVVVVFQGPGPSEEVLEDPQHGVSVLELPEDVLLTVDHGHPDAGGPVRLDGVNVGQGEAEPPFKAEEVGIEQKGLGGHEEPTADPVVGGGKVVHVLPHCVTEQLGDLVCRERRQELSE